ncbi:TVP38/TMEM64 family protein, partial [Lacticaseibacillus paracasei]|uniref:TVP38/TMEM64 family protein n=1 Tax=Lacticaseibacillus paracasei TaxID=1597 RepID=UPI002F263A86
MNPKNVRRLINFATIVVVILLAAVAIYWYDLGILSNINALQAYIARLGIAGALFFMLIQVIQVVIPIIPGGVSTAAGVILFGPWTGFFYNYIGIAIGSFINFHLARRFGKPLLTYLISEKTYNKYIGYTKNQQRFDRFFTLAIILPVAPADVLCLLAGLTKMTFKKFFWIIILGKPISILAY